MKKVLGMFFLLITLCLPIVSNALATNSSYDNIKVYFFYEEDCKDCEKAKEWLEEELKEHQRVRAEYVKIENNQEFSKQVKNTLQIKKDTVPLMVIGSNSFLGFSSKVKNNLTEAMESYEEAESYCDVISKIRNQEDVKDCMNQNKEIYHPSTGLSTLVKIVLGMVGIGFVVGVIFLVQKKKLLSRLHR